MKLYKASFFSFVISILHGALLFLGIGFVFYLLGPDLRHGVVDSDEMGIALVLYVIYVVIQFWLSSINLIQAIYLDKKGRLFEEEDGIHVYFLGEIILYLIVFIALSLLCREGFVTLVILIFSIPYVLCCSASVYMFRYFLRRFIKTDISEPAIEDEVDSAEISAPEE